MNEKKKKETQFYEEMSNAEYRQREGLASTDIKRMMKSMALWKFLKDNPEENTDTPSLKFGRAYHKFCLEPYDFENEFVVSPKIDRRTKEGKEAYEAFVKEAEGKEVIDQEMYDQLTKMREVLYATPYVKKLLAGEHEKSMFWVDKKTGIKCKCRADSFGVFGNINVIVDLKTVSDAETTAFMRDAMKFGYDIQAAHYLEGIQTVTGKEYKFVFVAQEKSAPYLCNVLEADEFFIRNGYEVRDELLKTYLKCLELNEYPAYMGFASEKKVANELTVPAWIRNAMGEEQGYADEND